MDRAMTEADAARYEAWLASSSISTPDSDEMIIAFKLAKRLGENPTNVIRALRGQRMTLSKVGSSRRCNGSPRSSSSQRSRPTDCLRIAPPHAPRPNHSVLGLSTARADPTTKEGWT